MAKRRNVAVFFNPIAGTPCWIADPTGNYRKKGWGEFCQFKSEFPYSPTGRNGLPNREEAIASAQSLYWQVARGEA